MASSPDQGKPPTAPKSLTRDDYRVGWVCALPVEQAAAIAMLDGDEHPMLRNPPKDSNAYTLGSIGKHHVVIAGLPMGGIGVTNAAIVADQMVRTFQSIKFVLMVGIGAGIPPEVRLGDVVVSVPTNGYPGVVQWDFGEEVHGNKFRRTGALNNPSPLLLKALGNLEARRDLGKSKIQEYLSQLEKKLGHDSVSKFRRPDLTNDVLFNPVYNHVKHSPLGGDNGYEEEGVEEEESCKYCDKAQVVKRKARGMKEHYGLIASGNSVIKNPVVRDNLPKELDSPVLCIEMEAAGLMNNFPCIVIRGICDYADSHKNKIWQPHAAAVAAAYAKDLLGYVLPEEVRQEQPAKDVISRVELGVKQIQAGQKSRQDDELLEWLTPLNFGQQQSEYCEIRQQGTGQWFLSCESYRDWVDGMNQILFCPGNPGAGKTILTSIVVDDLEEKFDGDSTVGIAYVYCNYNSEETQKPKDLISSLLKQLLLRQPSLLRNIQALYDKHKQGQRRPTLDEIFKILETVANGFSRVFLIVDALDEYQSSSRGEFLEKISCLRAGSRTNIFATSRPIPEIEKALPDKLTVEVQATEDDILKYLSGRLAKLPRVVSGNKDLQDKITSSIVEAADGVFLLAQFHFATLLEQDTINDIKEVLQNLATGIDAYKTIYDDAMERIVGQSEKKRKRAKQILSWVTFARRLLTEDELQHALGVKIGAPEFDEGNLPNVRDAISLCAGLVKVNKESNTVQFVHKTTQDYFDREHARWFRNAQSYITATCTTYLSFSYFGDCCIEKSTGLWHRLKPYPFYNYAATNWGYHAQALSTYGEYMPFLEEQDCVATAGRVLLYDEIRYLHPDTMGSLHLVAYFGLDKGAAHLVKECNANVLADGYMTPLSWAADQGHEAVVKVLLDAKEINLSEMERTYGPLCVAIHRKHEAIIKRLLSHKKVDFIWEDGILTPLTLAIDSTRKTDKTLSTLEARSTERIVKLLLDTGKCDPSKKNGLGATPLKSAVCCGYYSVAKLLLDTKKVDPNQEDEDGMTLLLTAASDGYCDIVELLLTAGADPSSTDKSGRTSLHIAAHSGDTPMIEILLSKGADPNSKDNSGSTSLHIAAHSGDTPP
ncbi:hypothetical protein GGS26DRAFT_403231 [Hypomontagnella submonticulosa]|nr:hypothetical protein GGS26DRAFT_403231 [Hypomontagnella submonticulosa]